MYVCRNVPKDIRMSSLSFEHHFIVAPMEREQQEHWLKLADLNSWSLNELKQKINEAKGIQTKKLEEEPVEEPAKESKSLKYKDYQDFENKNCYLYPQKTVHQIAELAFNGSRETK